MEFVPTESKQDVFSVDRGGLMADLMNVSGKKNKVVDDAAFVIKFECETGRALDYFLSQLRSIELYAKVLLTETSPDAEIMILNIMAVEGLSTRAKDLSCRCLQFDGMVHENFKVLEEIGREADSRLATECVSFLRQKLGHFRRRHSSTIVVALSDIHDSIRKLKDTLKRDKDFGTSTDVEWRAPDSFVRSTTKYWIDDEKLTEVMLSAVTEVPLLVYGTTGRISSKMDIQYDLSSDKLWDGLATPISSIYFDSEDCQLYKMRLARGEGAQLLRVRWYGKQPHGVEPVFLELKTHHEQWINCPSVKERVVVQEKDMNRILAHDDDMVAIDAEKILTVARPELRDSDLQKAIDLLLRMKKLILNRRLRPCVRSTYIRAAFQSPESNSLRLTLDRFVASTDESMAPNGSWCIPQDAIVGEHATKHMPFSIFEVKLAGSAVPSVIQELIESGAIIEAEKFSKFLTGAAAFNSNKITVLPHWASHPSFARMFSLDMPKLQSQNSLPGKLSRADTTYSTSMDSGSYTEDIKIVETPMGARETKAFQKLRLKAKNKFPPVVAHRIAPKKPARVEPKSYFANERTFIQWISAALLLVTIAVLLLDFQAELKFARAAAKALGTFALFFVAYSLFVYYRRVRMLESGQPYGYVDHFGPFVLAVAIMAGVSVLLVQIFQSGDRNAINAAADAIGTKVLHQDTNLCFMHSSAGLSPLDFEPSDALVDTERQLLLVPSKTQIMGFPVPKVDADGNLLVGQSGPLLLLDIPGADIEALVYVDNILYAVDEENRGSKSNPISTLYAFEWADEALLRQAGKWAVPVGGTEGIAYVPGKDGLQGKLYLADNTRGSEKVVLFDLPTVLGTAALIVNELTPHHTLNGLVMYQGIEKNPKIGAMQYFENVLYILHDEARVVRAWDVDKGVLLSEWKVPYVDGFVEQWEGLAIERISKTEPTRLGGSLQQGSGDLLVHLALDTPLQVWSFVAKEGDTRGSIVFPDCAAAQ